MASGRAPVDGDDGNRDGGGGGDRSSERPRVSVFVRRGTGSREREGAGEEQGVVRARL